MSVTFLTNEDKAILDHKINKILEDNEESLDRIGQNETGISSLSEKIGNYRCFETFENGDILHSDRTNADANAIVLEGKTVKVDRQSKNLCSAGTVTFTTFVVVDIEEIPAGTYITSALITSNDTDSDRSAIQYMNGDTLIAAQSFARNKRYADGIFVTQQPINRLRLYASVGGYNDSTGDVCTFADIQIESAAGLDHFEVTDYEEYGRVSTCEGVHPRVTIGLVEFSADTDDLFDGDTLDFVSGRLHRASSADDEFVTVIGDASTLHGDLVVKTDGKVHIAYKKDLSNAATPNKAMKLFENKIRYFGIAGACGNGLSQCAESIIQCAHCGMDGVEVDVRLAADGTVMIMHNEDISGVVDAEAGTLVSSKTLDQLKAYKFKNDWIQYGYYKEVKMITLDECIQLCKKYGLLITIDIKSDGYEEENQITLLDNIIAVCMKHGVQDSVVYSSPLHESRKYIRSKLPNAHIAVKKTISNTTVDADIADIVDVGGNILMQVEGDPGEDILTPERVAQYHRYCAPVKDRDYIFTYDKPGVNKCSISYLFQFTTADDGVTWSVDTANSCEEASATTTLTQADDVYSFINHYLPPYLLSVASPMVSVMDDKIGQYAVAIRDYSGVKFRRISGDMPSKITIRLDF